MSFIFSWEGQIWNFFLWHSRPPIFWCQLIFKFQGIPHTFIIFQLYWIKFSFVILLLLSSQPKIPSLASFLLKLYTPFYTQLKFYHRKKTPLTTTNTLGKMSDSSFWASKTYSLYLHWPSILLCLGLNTVIHMSFSSCVLSHSVAFDSLWPHGL